MELEEDGSMEFTVTPTLLGEMLVRGVAEARPRGRRAPMAARPQS